MPPSPACRAIDTSLRKYDDSLANLAALLLRMGKPEEAEELYKTIPEAGNCSEADLLRDDKPRYSG
jgi:thioredoxin-like negative regulator of GroEL